MTANEMIKKLQELVEQNGDCEVAVYKSFSKETVGIREGDIMYDDRYEDIYIGIYA